MRDKHDDSSSSSYDYGHHHKYGGYESSMY
jgi:hypothetical protein